MRLKCIVSGGIQIPGVRRCGVGPGFETGGPEGVQSNALPTRLSDLVSGLMRAALIQCYHSVLTILMTITSPRIAARAEESRQLARVHTLRAQDKDRRRYDSKHQMVSYAPGDLVWVYTPLSFVENSDQLFDQVSEFDRGRIEAYTEIVDHLSGKSVVSVGRGNQTTIMRICDRWMQESTTDRRWSITSTSVHPLHVRTGKFCGWQ
ncbi:hypothetical protein TNCV_3976851 [Trichonephila clavipes]|nr:hypothetical protein TNCV_3976851 [Trichonephila clavipes]